MILFSQNNNYDSEKKNVKKKKGKNSRLYIYYLSKSHFLISLKRKVEREGEGEKRCTIWEKYHNRIRRKERREKKKKKKKVI